MAAIPNVTSESPDLRPATSRWQPGAVGTVYLNGTAVGSVVVTGWDASWGFGRFQPTGRFDRFAPTFGLWSRLMHADGDGRPLTRSSSDALAAAENAMDAIKARLYFPVDEAWVDAFQLNIDGEMLEWKEY